MAAALEGKAALVTGGGSGIGLDCARALLVDGACVTIAGRTEDRLRAAAEALEELAPAGAEVRWVTCDVTAEDDVRAAVGVAAEPVGGLHVAVANAGRGGLGPIVTTALEEWEGILATNLTGAFLTIKHAGAAIARSGGGSIVAISSIAGVLTHRFMGPYCVSKAGIDMLVRTAADELGVAGVRVNSVRPGLVETELVEGVMGLDDTMASYLDAMPIRRVGQVGDVSAAVRWLAGPESSWVTGVTLSVDGGHHLRGGPDFAPVTRMLFGDATDGVVEG